MGKIEEEATASNSDMPPLSADLMANIRNTKSRDEFIAALNKAKQLQSVMGKRILALMDVSDLDVLIEVLRLLQIMGKRSKFLTQRLKPEDQTELVQNLTAIAQCWGGKLRSVKMADCIDEALAQQQLFPFHFIDNKGKSIQVDRLPDHEQLATTVARIKKDHDLDRNDAYCLLSRIRMQKSFNHVGHRVNCVIARLLSISTLIYCRCQTDENNVSSLLYAGFIEEVISLLKIEYHDHVVVDAIQTEALCTLCSIVSLEKEPKISQILESLSAGNYHGFLAVMTRNVVDELKRNELGKQGHSSVALSTALFSFLYHLGSVEPGGETLVGCGLTQILVSVIAHHDVPLELITFATRCSRIIDLFTTIDVTAFRNCNGMEICVNRIVHEINECRKEEPFVIESSMDVDFKDDDEPPVGKVVKPSTRNLSCHQQRCGLIKGLVTFVKRAIQDAQLQDSIRHIMEGDLPEALIHILSNSDYYSSSLFHQTIQLITNFIYQEPGQLTLLQQKHIPFVMLQCLLRKELPTSRDVITHLANVFTALCLNDKGLKQFTAYEPFDQFFKIIISIKFLTTMKKRRSEMTDAAQNVGTALDDLLRHQPTLRQSMLNSLIKILDRLVSISQRPPPNAEIVMSLGKSHSRAASLPAQAGQNAVATGSGEGDDTPPQNVNDPRHMQRVVMEVLDETFGIVLSPRNGDGEEMSDVDDEAEIEMGSDDMPQAQPHHSQAQEEESDDEIMGLDMVQYPPDSRTNGTLPLGDYMIIIAKILETLTATNGPGVVEFVEGLVEKGAVNKLLQLCQVPNFSHEVAQGLFPTSVASIIKHMILHRNTRSTDRLMEAIFSSFIRTISPLLATPPPEGSVSLMMHLGEKTIFEALANLDNILPILLSITRNSLQMPPELRNKLWDTWLSKSGDKLLNGLRKVARILSWESSLIKQLKPSSRTLATQTDPGELEQESAEGATSSRGHIITNTGCMTAATDVMMESETVDNVMCVAAEKSTTTRPASWIAAGIKEEENDFWLKHKNVADIINKSNRSVNDVLNTLARSCFSPSQRRQRRYDPMQTVVPPNALKIAANIFNAIYRDFKWTRKTSTNTNIIEFGRLSALVVQLSMTMFDDREKIQPATLQKFYLSGCHQAFCQLLSDDLLEALTNMPKNQEGGIITLLTEWCQLAGRLINKANINTTAKTTDFDLNKYLKLLNTDLFASFTKLFKVLSREDIDLSQYELLCDLSMEVYKEVVASLMPADEEKKEEGQTAGSNGRQSPALAEDDIRSLVDMGFDRRMAEQALRDTGGNPADAADYLLAMAGGTGLMNRDDIAAAIGGGPRDLPEYLIARALEGAVTPRSRERHHRAAAAVMEQMNLLDMERTDRDRAGAEQQPQTGTGELPAVAPPTSPSATDQPGTSGTTEQPGTSTPNTVDKDKPSTSSSKQNDDFLYDRDIPKANVPNLKDVNIDTNLMVSRACIELFPLCKRLMEFGSDLVFSCADLVISLTKSVYAEWRNSELIENILYKEIVAMANKLMSSGHEEKLVTSLGTRIHFACLLFDHVAQEYIEKIKDTGFVGKLIDLVEFVYSNFEKKGIQRELLSPLILWLDLYDKNTRSERRLSLLKSVTDKLNWSYLSDEAYGGRNKKWQQFNTTQQNTLNAAFFGGKDSVTLKTGSFYRRDRDSDVTVDFTTMRQTRSATNANGNPTPSGSSPVNVEIPNGDTPTTVNLTAIVQAESESIWNRDMSSKLIILIVRILHKNHIHHTAAHSLLSFIARLTKHSEHASDFLQQGGIAAIIQLHCAPSPSTIKLTSIIIRHCLDDENLIAQVFEKCIRSHASVPQANFLTDYLGVAPNRPKEWYETLYKLAPLAIRSPSVFVSIMEQKVKAEQQSSNQMMTFNVNGKSELKPILNERTTEIVQLLLNEAVHGEWDTQPQASNAPLAPPQTRMLSRADIMLLLSELTKSYPCVAPIICEAKDQQLSVMQILIDKYTQAPAQEQRFGFGKPMSGALKTLVSVLAQSNHSPKAQESLVTDVKNVVANLQNTQIPQQQQQQQQTLPAALPQKDKEEKPTPTVSDVVSKRLNEICQLIQTMCECCETQLPAPPAHRRMAPVTHNPIVKLFHKKRIANDLIRTIHMLKLNNKESIESVHNILKTLDALMKNVGQTTGSHATGERGERRIEIGVTTQVMHGNDSMQDDQQVEHEPDRDERIEIDLAQDIDLQQARREMEEEDGSDDEDDHPMRDDDEDDSDSEENEIRDDAMEEDDVEDSMSSDEDHEDENESENHDEEQQNAEEQEGTNEGAERRQDASAAVEDDEEGHDRHNETNEEEESGDDDDEGDYDDIYDEAYEDDMHLDHTGAVAFFENVINHGPLDAGIVLDHRFHHNEWEIFGGPIRGPTFRGNRDPPPAVHPLLVRPQQFMQHHNAAHVPLAHGNLPPTGGVYRFIATTSNHPANLTRQNAIRRFGGTQGRLRAMGGHFFDQLFELGITGRSRPLINVLDSALTESPEERRLRQPTNVPSALDRLAEEMQATDPLSANYIYILIAHIVTQTAKNKMKEEKEKAEKEKKEAAATREAQKAKEDAERKENEGQKEGETSTAQTEGQATAAEQSAQAEAGENQQEPMEVNQHNEASNEAEDVSMEDAPPHSTAATVASSVAGEDADEQMRSPTEPEVDQSALALSTVQSVSTADSTTTAAEMQPATEQPVNAGSAAPADHQPGPSGTNQDYSAILGDIGPLPDGVDPAFLAALPEDMRNEVLRDCRAQLERQRRAQAAAAAQQNTATPAAIPAATSSANPTDPNAQTNVAPANAQPNPANVPTIEPIDQEFLAALPPELQEEILAQHERAVREAEAARRAPPPEQPELDGAAVIASLPANERAQVLAEMDDAELQRLPQNLQDEARRARANMTHYDNNNLLRMIVGGRNGIHHAGGLGLGRSPARGGQFAGPSIGQSAGQGTTANAQTPQILDKDATMTLCMLFLVDKLNMQKVQKVIRSACVNASTCDFVIYALMSLLDKASEAVEEEEEMVSSMPPWLESVTVSGVGHNEKAVKINKNASKVSIHSLLSSPVCRNILETLASIAKAYPGNLLPAVLRKENQELGKQPLQFQQFWQMVQSNNAKQIKQEDWPAGTSPVKEFDASPVIKLFDYFNKPVIMKNQQLQERLMKVISTVVQTLPTDTCAKLQLPDDEVVFPQHLKVLINVPMAGQGLHLHNDTHSLTEGLTLLAELMRSFTPATSKYIYELLFKSIIETGLELRPQIERLVKELDEFVIESSKDQPMEEDKPSTSSSGAATSSNQSPDQPGGQPQQQQAYRYAVPVDRREMRNRFEGDRIIIDGEENSRLMIGASSCKELQLPAVTALTDKSGAQYRLLNSLHTLVKVRDTIHQLNEKRRKEREEEKRKKEEEERKAAEAAAKEKEAETKPAEGQGTSNAGGQPSEGASSAQPEQPQTETATAMEVSPGKPKEDEKEDEREEPRERLSERLADLNEKHRQVLNQALRQNSNVLSAGGPFAILTKYPKLLDFDVKRKYFRKELSKLETRVTVA
ncbi:hypothetical protein WR25_24388 [Diploscapter pachys]|uniref:UBA domain-containing protein n=1 Tax=Diploscapter pachys TaxID=2018661 RepID=A0A2A2LTI0_9BILA|nr:hypothetical protein WR25_24388 [Diploscapter pachys]